MNPTTNKVELFVPKRWAVKNVFFHSIRMTLSSLENEFDIFSADYNQTWEPIQKYAFTINIEGTFLIFSFTMLSDKPIEVEAYGMILRFVKN